jgi:hypothetical protein
LIEEKKKGIIRLLTQLVADLECPQYTRRPTPLPWMQPLIALPRLVWKQYPQNQQELYEEG